MLIWVISLSATDLSARSLTAADIYQHSEFVRVWQAVKPPSPISSSTSGKLLYATLFLKTFRGERAISQFDWPFTPIHRSSQDFSTSTGSVLQLVLPNLQPAHG